MKRVLIVGCGYVGTALAERLVRRGDACVCLSRRPRQLPAGATPLIADLLDPALRDELPRELDGVVYTAAPDDGTQAAYERVYVKGLDDLMHALRRNATYTLPRLIVVSSTGVYSRGRGEWVDESVPADGALPTAMAIREGEKRVWRSPFDKTVVRFGGIYGPGRTSLVESVQSGTAVLYDGEPEYTNRIHRDDCAGVLAHLVDLPELKQLYLGVDCEPALRDDVLTFIAERLGKAPLPRRPKPEQAGGAGRGSNRRASSALLRESGYVFTYPTYREGFASLIAAASERS